VSTCLKLLTKRGRLLSPTVPKLGACNQGKQVHIHTYTHGDITELGILSCHAMPCYACQIASAPQPRSQPHPTHPPTHALTVFVWGRAKRQLRDLRAPSGGVVGATVVLHVLERRAAGAAIPQAQREVVRRAAELAAPVVVVAVALVCVCARVRMRAYVLCVRASMWMCVLDGHRQTSRQAGRWSTGRQADKHR
jgi:hypothetical protein